MYPWGSRLHLPTHRTEFHWKPKKFQLIFLSHSTATISVCVHSILNRVIIFAQQPIDKNVQREKCHNKTAFERNVHNPSHDKGQTTPKPQIVRPRKRASHTQQTTVCRMHYAFIVCACMTNASANARFVPATKMAINRDRNVSGLSNARPAVWPIGNFFFFVCIE